MKFDPQAIGKHTDLKRNRKTNEFTNYETYKSNPLNSSGFDKVKSYKGIGKDHIKKITKQNVPTPHVTGKSIPGELGKHIRMKFQERGREYGYFTMGTELVLSKL